MRWHRAGFRRFGAGKSHSLGAGRNSMSSAGSERAINRCQTQHLLASSRLLDIRHTQARAKFSSGQNVVSNLRLRVTASAADHLNGSLAAALRWNLVGLRAATCLQLLHGLVVGDDSRRTIIAGVQRRIAL